MSCLVSSAQSVESAVIALAFAGESGMAASIRVVRLRCEYRVNPVGIGGGRPRGGGGLGGGGWGWGWGGSGGGWGGGGRGWGGNWGAGGGGGGGLRGGGYGGGGGGGGGGGVLWDWGRVESGEQNQTVYGG